MKKYLFLAIAGLIMAATQVSAQISVEASYENSRYRQQYNNDVEWGDPLQGFGVGAYYNINLFCNDLHAFSIQPGLKYSYVTFREVEEEGQVSMKMSLNQHYLNVPIRFQYALQVMPGLRVLAFAAPNFSLGLSNTINLDIIGEEVGFNLYTGEVTGTLPLVGDVGEYLQFNMRRFDVSAQVGLGVEIMDRYEIRGGYDFGLVNLMPDTSYSTTRNNFFVGVGFRF